MPRDIFSKMEADKKKKKVDSSKKSEDKREKKKKDKEVERVPEQSQEVSEVSSNEETDAGSSSESDDEPASKKKKKDKKREKDAEYIPIVKSKRKKEINEIELVSKEPKMTREEWKKCSEALKEDYDLKADETMFDETLRQMSKKLDPVTQDEYIQFRYISKLPGEKIFWWMYKILIGDMDDDLKRLTDHCITGMQIRNKETQDAKDGLEKKLTEEEILERKIRSELLSMNKIEKRYRQKVVYKSKVDTPFTFYINIGKSWSIKSDLMKLTSGDNEFFPVVSIIKASQDPSQRKPYAFNIASRHVRFYYSK